MLQDWSRRFIHPSMNQTQPGAARASWSHTRMIYVSGEEHGLLNSDVTDRVGLTLISYYSVALFNLSKHCACTKIEAL